MKKKTIKILLILTVFIFFSNITKAADFVKLDIKIVKVYNDKIECNFRYHFNINENDSIKIFLHILPFTKNPRMNHSISTEDIELFVTHGFNQLKKGLININTFGKSAKFYLEFLNVELPIEPFEKSKNGLAVTLDFCNDNLPEMKNVFNIPINELIISNTSLIDSDLKIELIKENTYRLAFSEITLEKVYFVIPKSIESLFLWIIIVGNIILGLPVSLGLRDFIKRKKKLVQVGLLIGGAVFVGIFVLLNLFCLNNMASFEETVAFGVISVIKLALGMFLGVVLQSVSELIQKNEIKKVFEK
jgi:hypothetical protein